MGKCKFGRFGACEKLFRPNCPDDESCYGYELMTNADRIRAMNDVELADFIWNEQLTAISQDGIEGALAIFRRLQQPAPEEGEQNV